MAEFDSIEAALVDLSAGRPIVVVDGEDQESEGDLVCPAELISTDWMAFIIRYSSGYVCTAMNDEVAERLNIPPMTAINQDPKRTSYGVSVDARSGIGTGISAVDRARTARVIADPKSDAMDLTRPGHMVTLRAQKGGVLTRPGHTEAAVDLMCLSGLSAAGVLCEIVSEEQPTEMARLAELHRFAQRHSLRIIRIADLIDYILWHKGSEVGSSLPEAIRVADPILPVRGQAFRAIGYRVDDREHIALVAGDVRDATSVLVRVHSECLTGDVFGSARCDCGDQLEEAMAAIGHEQCGVLIYLRGHEGRGIGLLNKLAAYQLQDQGLDTVDANLRLGLPVDARSYRDASAIINELGIRSIRLLTNNPHKVSALECDAIAIAEVVPSRVVGGEHNRRYMNTKIDRMGHRRVEQVVDTGVQSHLQAG